LQHLDDTVLNGFNLLGVIANPRGTPLSSYHGHTRQPSQDLSTMEWTVSQMTEGMESLNQYLEDWSRQILEESEYNVEEVPESQLQELPTELRVDTATLQSYLQESGALAQSFQSQRQVVQDAQDEQDLNELPQLDNVFWDPHFDLTDSQTFGQLLLCSQGMMNDDSNDDTPMEEWLPLPPPDTFTSQLDQVELCLLNQVRQRSDAFFEESIRMSQLQEWILELLQQVSSLQSSAQQLETDLWQPLSSIPYWNQQQTQLQQLHDTIAHAQELMQTKSSIAGYLSAQEYPSAIQQIQYARQLLKSLHRLTAFGSIQNQLDEYEQLVVTNLRDELVELFLEWQSTAESSRRVEEIVYTSSNLVAHWNSADCIIKVDCKMSFD